MSLSDTQARRNLDLSLNRAHLSIGVCLSVDVQTGVAVVEVGGGAVPMAMLNRPTVGDRVHVLTAGGDRLCLGPAWRSPLGEVVGTPSAGLAAVLLPDGSMHELPYSTALTLSDGDQVAIDWEAGLIVAEPAAEAASPGSPTGPPGSTVETEHAFYPVASGSYGSSWFTNRVYSSDSNIGVFLYEGIADTIPDSAEILSVGLYLHAIQTYGGNPTIGLHSLTSLSGAPSVTSAVAVPGGTGWKSLPTSFGDALKTGTARGVGTNHGGYHIFAPANDGNSGTLTIRYRVTV